jgi:hypothetical protein
MSESRSLEAPAFGQGSSHFLILTEELHRVGADTAGRRGELSLRGALRPDAVTPEHLHAGLSDLRVARPGQPGHA